MSSKRVQFIAAPDLFNPLNKQQREQLKWKQIDGSRLKKHEERIKMALDEPQAFCESCRCVFNIVIPSALAEKTRNKTLKLAKPARWMLDVSECPKCRLVFQHEINNKVQEACALEANLWNIAASQTPLVYEQYAIVSKTYEECQASKALYLQNMRLFLDGDSTCQMLVKESEKCISYDTNNVSCVTA